jgi:NAD dependent epimerase/dehydratase family enzyme
MSWITVDDAAALFAFALESPGVSGVLNGTAPSPVRNADFAKALGKALSRPAILPVPGFAVKLLFGEMGQIVLGGQKVLPRRTLAAGFSFSQPSLDGALASVLSAPAS